MIWNYIKTGFRSFFRKPIYAILNIVGLAVGLASFLIIIAITKYEESFDKGMNGENHLIHRVFWQRTDADTGEVNSTSPGTMYPFGDNFMETFGDHVKYYARVTFTDGIIQVDKDKIEMDGYMMYGDPDILKITRVKMLAGDVDNSLANPNNIVISKTFAKTYFGEENPVGKEMKFYNTEFKGSLQVTGVYEDFPTNNTFRPNGIISASSVVGVHKYFKPDDWAIERRFSNFLVFENEENRVAVEAGMAEFVKTIKPLVTDDNNWAFLFQPIDEMRFGSDFQKQEGQIDFKLILNTIKIIGLLILMISWVNFINMSTASAITRAREIGARKAIGAVRKDVIIQFFVEAIIYNIIALFLAFGLMSIVVKPFLAFTQADYTYEMFFRFEFLWYMIGIVILGIICSGLYPALVLSSFKPRLVMNSKTASSKATNVMRRTLVGLQYFISLALLMGTGVLIHQTWYLNGLDNELTTENIMALRGPQINTEEKVLNTYRDFVTALKDLPMVQNASASTSFPSFWTDNTSSRLQSSEEKKGNIRASIGVDENYFDLYEIPFIAGENFRTGNETTSLIMSEKARLSFKLDELEKVFEDELNVYTYDYRFKIRGVVKDYKHDFRDDDMNKNGMIFMPLVGIFKKPTAYSIKFQPGVNTEEGIAAVKKVYETYYPDDLFKYEFIDDSYRDLMEGQHILERVFLVFCMIAFTLMVMGIMGLSSFIANMRLSEVAVRKILGAKFADVIKVLSKEFVIIIVITSIIAVPAIWFIMNQWLQGYYYRISIGVQHFIIPFLIVSGVTSLVILYNTIKVFRIHPSKALSS